MVLKVYPSRPVNGAGMSRQTKCSSKNFDEDKMFWRSTVDFSGVYLLLSKFYGQINHNDLIPDCGRDALPKQETCTILFSGLIFFFFWNFF